MINDAAPNIPNGSLLRTNLCIVGGGPVGLALAQAVASSQCRVILLESGGRSVSHAANHLTAAEQSGDLWEPVRDTRTRGLGGTSVQWTSADPDSPKAFYQLSLAAARLGDEAGAQRYVQVYQEKLQAVEERVNQLRAGGSLKPSLPPREPR